MMNVHTLVEFSLSHIGLAPHSRSTDLVVLEHSQLHLLMLVLDLLGGGVVLLLALLATAEQTQREVEGGLLLDRVAGEAAVVLQHVAGERQHLVGRWRVSWFVS